ncbi:MAG: AMP-binding protein [Oscillospiraceae bacterium]|nr:AMP-binding protein [Oscillospiraceae bacterium]
METKDLHLKYVREKYDEKGRIVSFDLDLPDNFNFAYDIVDEIGKNDPERTALIWIGDDLAEKRFTYADLMRESNRTANMLIAHGVKKGDKVICVLKRHYQVYFAILALCKIGAVMIPATNQLRKWDFEYRFNAAKARFVIATNDDHVTENIDLGLQNYDGIVEKFAVHGIRDGWTDFDCEIAKYPDTFERADTNVNEDMLMFFSSGTTGYPKMVAHSYHYAAAHILTAKHWHHIDSETLHLTISDSGWGKFFWGKIYGEMALGCTIFVYDFERFHPDRILSLIEKYRITSLCCPPTMYRFFIKEGLDKYDLSSLKYATTAGEALNAEVYNKFLQYTGLKLMEGFGQTETVIVLGNLYGYDIKPGSMGRPVPLYDVVLVDKNDNEVPVGKEGEICIRLDTDKKNWGLFRCYYGGTDHTLRAKRNNLYHTGDTAYKDEDGFFWYIGRIDDVIKSSGYRIGPFEIESILSQHPAVLEVAVTGAPDPIRGTVVKATIVLTDEYKDKAGPELMGKLQEFVKSNTAPYKYPRIIEFSDTLPKTTNGKIRRVEIRERDAKRFNS